MKMRTLNIGFSVFEDSPKRITEDETQFDVEDTGDFAGMITELVDLFNDFCDENGFRSVRINYIEEEDYVE